ncbi:nitrilase-related carbon-nitrogen hydrolase [Oceaniglobus ichthyenteri]|uniref:nitrilase-related carbon-nitrogen hydrolase n=1 Tax=Oceaniglobus ichthyenteri TaxID=2136177 RepID=UPI0013DD91AD|nr:nitrilase-related carbon-nitrogen hydrolase [Oceaniglobus ichthyenteri]
MKFAVSAWPVERHPDWAGYVAKLQFWVRDAAQNGAELLVFPEYAGLEAALIGAAPDAPDWLLLGDSATGANIALHRELAKAHGVHIVMGSAPFATPRGYVNRAHLITPDGRITHQDKQILTPWERRETNLIAGDAPAVFDTDLGRIAVLICYDSEFPLLTHALNADLLLVPSCTDAPTGAARIRIAAMARALEGQRIVASAATIGAVPDCEFLDENCGRAGVYAPADVGFSQEGVIYETPLNQPGWAFGTVDRAAMANARESAQVTVPGHWEEQIIAAKDGTLRRPGAMCP